MQKRNSSLFLVLMFVLCLYVVEGVAVHLQVFVDGEEGAQEGDDKPEEEDRDGHDDDGFHVDDGDDLWLEFVEPV